MEHISKWIAGVRNAGTWLLVPFLSVAALMLTFGVIAREVANGRASVLDQYVMFAFRSSSNFSNPVGPAWVQEAVRDVTSLGSFPVLGLLLMVVAGYLVVAGNRGSAWLAVLAVLGGVALGSLLKLEFARPRPDMFVPAARVFTSSFPSDHATLSAITYLTLAAVLAKTIGSPAIRNYFIAVAMTLTVLIGVSRIYLGVHYPTDVLAGWCIGSAWAICCWTLFTRVQLRCGASTLWGRRQRRSRTVVPPSTTDL